MLRDGSFLDVRNVVCESLLGLEIGCRGDGTFLDVLDTI